MKENNMFKQNKKSLDGGASLGLSMIYINRYFKLVLGAYGFDKDKDLVKLGDRMMEMYKSQNKRKNNKFIFLFFKDLYSITQFKQIGRDYKATKCLVALDSDGYPLYIGTKLIERLKSNNESKLYPVVLNLLAVHRIIPGGPAPDLSTVTKPFSGISETLSENLITRGLKQLREIGGKSKNFTLGIKPCSLLTLRSASPSGSDSIRFILKDSYILLCKPKYLLLIVQGLIKTKSYFILCVLIGSIGLSIFYRLSNGLNVFKHFNIGKISYVYNVAGKSRVIGITNYGVQVALQPLHEAILQFLKSLPTDGTFNQLAPIKRLERTDGLKSSLDLSAATDRLPLSFQTQVLGNMLNNPELAALGSKIIDFDLYVKDADLNDGSHKIRYAVGQAMGTYSSGASLALSHHAIVQIASPTKTDKYAVLGDDLVIDDEISQSYITIIESLGMEIQLTKSLLKDKHCEFAKKIFDLSKNGSNDYSIIGPKLFIGAIKNPMFKIKILFELLRRNLMSEYEVLNKLNALSKRKSSREYSSFGKGALYGPLGIARLDLSSVPFGRERFLKAGAGTELLCEDIEEEISIFNEFPVTCSYYMLALVKYKTIILEALANLIDYFYLELFYKEVTFRELINHVLLYLSPFSFIILRDNIKAVLHSYATLFNLYFKEEEEGVELEELAELIHPKVVGSDHNIDLELAKSELSMMRKLHKYYLIVNDYIDKDIITTRVKLSQRDTCFRHVIPGISDDKV